MVWFREGKGKDILDEYYSRLWELLCVVSGESKREKAGHELGGIAWLLSEYLVGNVFSFVILRGREEESKFKEVKEKIRGGQ